MIIAEYKNKFFNKYKVLRTFQDDNSGLEFPVGYPQIEVIGSCFTLNHPKLGEDTRQMLTDDLNFSQAEITALTERHII